MRVFSLISLSCIIGLGLAKHAPLSDEQIDYINSVQKSWVAGRNFDESQFQYAKNLLGVDMEANNRYNKEHTKNIVDGPVDISALPENYDPRNYYPDCYTMREVRDQSECGSCWAFGVAEALSDRVYIATGENLRISAEDILACCGERCGHGCNGGYPFAALEWYVDTGVVTGGRYNSNKGCYPYSMPPCDHHCSGRLRNCTSEIRPTPECVPDCLDNYPLSYAEDKHFGSRAYTVSGVENIMYELYTKGPASACFYVYEDFFSYKSGVYKHVTGEYLGGHAVKVIGWGVENGEDYWLLVNSWNRDWGDDGLFKIAKGHNECSIEDSIQSADVIA